MEVEVLRREVREDGDVDLAAAQLPQRERVARGLEHAPRPPGHEELGEELLHLDGLLGALPRLVLPDVPDLLEVDCRGEAGTFAGGLEDVRDEMHRRRLAVGPGDGGELEPPGRVVEELAREVGERDARVRDDRHRDAHGHVALGDDRDGAARGRVGGEVVSVPMEALDRDEEAALADPTRVVRDRADVAFAGPLGHGDPRRTEQRLEPHPAARPRSRRAAV